MVVFKLRDLYEAVFLNASGQRLNASERGAGPPYWFIFTEKKACEELSNAFWNGEAVVKAKAYADVIRTLKNWLFAQK